MREKTANCVRKDRPELESNLNLRLSFQTGGGVIVTICSVSDSTLGRPM